MKRSHQVMSFAITALVALACGGKGKKSDTPAIPVETPKNNQSSSNTTPKVENPDLKVPQVPQVPQTPQQNPAPVNPTVTACSSAYTINGTANPFLAGSALTAELAYPGSTDTAEKNSPVLVTPDDSKCFDAGRRLYFQVNGSISFGDLPDQTSDADGFASKVTSHMLGSANNLSNIQAPINSLIGVFLDNSPIASRGAAPESLDFSESAARNFSTLSPKVGQIFFIGNGKDDSGNLQSFVVPNGTARLYLAIMDEYEWNNNLGQLSGTIQWVKP